MKASRFTPEAKIIIDTVIDDWFERFDREMLKSRAVDDLKESLYENLKRFNKRNY